MKLPWVNGGQEFIPQTTSRHLMDVMLEERRLRKEHASEDVTLEAIQMQIRMIAKVLSVTDASVTEDVVLDSVPPWQMLPLFKALFKEPTDAAEI